MSTNPSSYSEVNSHSEVYDEADQASMIQMAETEQALAAVRSKVAPETHPDFDGQSCLDCGDDIHKDRLKMGKIRCVHCQSALEKRSKQYQYKD